MLFICARCVDLDRGRLRLAGPPSSAGLGLKASGILQFSAFSKHSLMSTDQCAMNKDGTLKDATEIVFYHDVDDVTPISGPSNAAASIRGRNKNARMLASIESDKYEADGVTLSKPGPVRRRKPKKKKTKGQDVDSGLDDEDYSDSGSGTTTDGSSEVEIMDAEGISDEELASILPAKTFLKPSKVKGKEKANPKKPKKSMKRRREHDEGSEAGPAKRTQTKNLRAASVEEVEDEEAPPRPAPPRVNKVPGGNGKRSDAIYLFYEQVPFNASGELGVPGLKKHLNKNFKHLHQFFEILQERRKQGVAWTQDDINVAAGRKPFDDKFAAALEEEIDSHQETIKEAFTKQRAAALEPWNQERFEELLVKWLVASNQPFSEVEQVEFIELLQYVHHSGGKLHIPKKDAIQRRVLKLGEATIEEIRDIFLKINGKVALSIDAWTSSNQHAFLAIVAHYINEEGQLEELLIDFRELLGEHSGENMADAVWKTLELYGLVGKIIAIVMDNATNNDTMMKSLEDRCRRRKVTFSAKASRLRCMPHTIHLAAIKLLEGIGAISSKTGRKLETRSSNYQDNFAIHVPPPKSTNSKSKTGEDKEDDEAVEQDEEEEDSLDELKKDGIIPSVVKLRKIVRHVRSSPQRREAWYREIQHVYAELTAEKSEMKLLMLILDVITRWGSTHQMMLTHNPISTIGRAGAFRDAIDSYASQHSDLLDYCLDENDWNNIIKVTGWLKTFRAATVQMSTTKTPMLSSTLEVLRELEDDIKEIIRSLGTFDVSVHVRDALVAAHSKLSEYFYKFDESPFYTWSMLLDPRIDREALEADYEQELTLAGHLNTSRQKLRDYYTDNYLSSRTSLNMASSVDSIGPSDVVHVDGSPQKKFKSKYHRKVDAVRDELNEFWKLSPEDSTCDPITWWVGHKVTYPHLYRLALDIFCIPGSAVAVERVFSGGRDTISLRRASLSAETIRLLMIAKHRLYLARNRK
ncbi:hypothetical protein D9758_010453 [Tetrapyrgos nigripes]|uniref:HAT C-terminal dimerisation domain-containing protein n=2 Tax=Tetrapyrgos nigripes TaxID=182062 RepID=A0A8H5CNQ4_9AGAR|nr:hypothetical protein D9758_010453 [Tetrapyrgos nigripes]